MYTSLLDFLNENVINKTLYHGSYTDNLTELKPHTNNDNTIPPSIFLTTKKSVARDYGDNIYKCKINCDNIKEYDVYGASFHNYRSFENDIYAAYNDGYDCVIFKNIIDSKEPNTKVPISDVYVVFDSKNVTLL